VRLGFVPVRKPGKLPGAVTGVDYALEYGSDRLEIHSDALADGPKVLIIDDLLATGGTAAACAELVAAAGGELCGFGFVAELAALEGRRKLPEAQPVESLIIYS
jgi:adenine phosphoribosyltransferase